MSVPLVAQSQSVLVGDIEIDPQDFSAILEPEQRITKCLACHGEYAGGDADFGPDTHFGTPALRGMREEYLWESLTAYQAGTRVHEEMSAVAAMLDEETTRFMAREFAAYDAPPLLLTDELEVLSGKDSMFQEGQAIARNGIPAQGVPACAACHGDLGQGSEIGPRLAGQNAMYIEGQLKAFNSGSRQTAQSAFMQPVVKDLAGDDIKAVAHYYESISESPVVRRSSSPRSR